jgi:hypothetical protein
MNILGTGLNDLELSLVLPNVGGVGERERSAKKCTLYTNDGGRVWAVGIVCVQRGITLEVYLFFLLLRFVSRSTVDENLQMLKELQPLIPSHKFAHTSGS